jgi:hypothetical protein
MVLGIRLKSMIWTAMPSFSLLRKGSRESSKKEQQVHVVHIGQLQQEQEPPSPEIQQPRQPEREQSSPQQQQNNGGGRGGSATVAGSSPVSNGSSWSPLDPSTSEDNGEGESASGAGSGTDSPSLIEGSSNKQERRNSKRDLLHDLISRGKIIGKQATTPLRGRRMSSQPPPPQRDGNGLVSPLHSFIPSLVLHQCDPEHQHTSAPITVRWHISQIKLQFA